MPARGVASMRRAEAGGLMPAQLPSFGLCAAGRREIERGSGGQPAASPRRVD